MCLPGIASYNPAYGHSNESFDRLGGAPAITAVAELFYRQVLADPLLAPYSGDVDMERQVAKQAAFLTMALGGPDQYTGRDLRTAHAGWPG